MTVGNGQIADLLGDIGEYGGGARIKLPPSFYIVAIELGEVDATPQRSKDDTDDQGNKLWSDDDLYIFDGDNYFLDGNEEKVCRGGSVYAEISCTVEEGPFAGNGFQSRFWLTPGKGKNIGFVQHAAKAISGRGMNMKALTDFGFIFTGKEDQSEAQQKFRKFYYALGVEDRLNFMIQYCNLSKWDGKSAVAKVDIEDGQEKLDETTNQLYTPQFNRYKGFYALNDGKKGAGYVRNVCHPKHEQWALEMGVITASEGSVNEAAAL